MADKEKVLGTGAKGDPEHPTLRVEADAKKDELKQEAERLGLSTSGTKEELLERIEGASQPTGQPGSPAGITTPAQGGTAAAPPVPAEGAPAASRIRR
jgi:hypothetical protein